MCYTGKCLSEDFIGECTMRPVDPNKCPQELHDGDVGEYDIPEELRDVSHYELIHRRKEYLE